MTRRWGRFRGRGIAVGVLAVVALATALSGRDEADAGLLDAAEQLVDGLLQPAYRDGDHVVFGDHAGAGTSRAKGAGSGGGTYHDGFSTYGDSKLADRYEIRLVASEGIEQVRPEAAAAVAAAAEASGVTLDLRDGTVAPTGPGRGQIDIVVARRSPCGGAWLGCGGPWIDRGTIQSGIIWINPRVFDRPPSELGNTVRHELGHTLGLAHYEYLHDGRVQTMHPTLFDAADYDRGDRAGLRFVGGDRAPVTGPAHLRVAAAPAPPPPPVDPAGALEDVTAGPFGITVRGWAADADARGPITVTVTVDGRPADVVADQPGPAGRADAFRAARPTGPGVHEVCAVARNAGGGVDTPLGCRSVAVEAPSVGQLGLQTF